VDPDQGGPKTCGSGGPGTLPPIKVFVKCTWELLLLSGGTITGTTTESTTTPSTSTKSTHDAQMGEQKMPQIKPTETNISRDPPLMTKNLAVTKEPPKTENPHNEIPVESPVTENQIREPQLKPDLTEDLNNGAAVVTQV
jgi:hypothetical protein